MTPLTPRRTSADATLASARSEARVLRLTDRWTQLKPVAAQQAYFWHGARFKVNPSGRRSGKTELAKRKVVLKLLERRPWPLRLFVAAPSFGQARDIYWQDLKDLVPSAWVASISETRLEITTRWGAMLRVFGFDRPRRIEGVPWDGGVIDEIADCPANCFKLNVRPALSTLGRKGWCDLVGVPDEVGRNQAEYEQLYMRGLKWPNRSDVCTFHWESSDVLDADEIAALREDMDELAFEQEMQGRFVSSGGKALPRFDPRFHINDGMSDYCPFLPLDWTLDFGVSPAVSLLCQSYRGQHWVLDEIYLKDGSTEAQADAFKQRVRDRGYSTRFIRLFGDAAGNQRSTNIGTSDYDTLRQHLAGYNVQWEQLENAPAVKDTLNAVRAACADVNNVVRLHVNSRCKTVIEDMRTAPWPDKKQLRPYHGLAALRYYLYQLRNSSTYSVGSMSLPNLGGMTGGIQEN